MSKYNYLNKHRASALGMFDKAKKRLVNVMERIKAEQASIAKRQEALAKEQAELKADSEHLTQQHQQTQSAHNKIDALLK